MTNPSPYIRIWRTRVYLTSWDSCQLLGDQLEEKKNFTHIDQVKVLVEYALDLKSSQMPIYRINNMHFMKVMHKRRPSSIELPFVDSILVQQKPMRYLPLDWAHFLTLFKYIISSYNFLSMSLCRAEPSYFVTSCQLYFVTSGQPVTTVVTNV